MVEDIERMLFVRALLAFLALPAVVAFIVPWLLLPEDRWRMEGSFAGWLILAFGLFVLLICVRDFYVFGKGTLAPWDPPKTLVTGGLYKFARNPMYLGVLGIVAGWSLITGSRVLGAYAAFGADPIIPPVPGLRQVEGIWTNGEITGMKTIPKRLTLTR